MLELKGLSKEFLVHQWGRRIEGFRDVSFSVNEGEFFGLSGQSGSGKSSLIKCIYRTYIPTAGKAVYKSPCNGLVDLAALPEHGILRLRKREIGYVPQFLQVVPRVPAVDVVAEPLFCRGVDLEEARERAEDLLSRLLLPRKLFDAYPSTFSGGEQQRVNLARAIIAGFSLLLLDEPTASLDKRAREIISEMLWEEKQRGATIVCISHDTAFLNNLADCIGIMKEGRMMEVLEA